MTVNITPNTIDDIGSFLEYSENIKLTNEIANYRPLRKPVTKHRPDESFKLKRKCRLIVRDWFFFAIWVNRLKKIIRSAPKLLEDREKRLEDCRLASHK